MRKLLLCLLVFGPMLLSIAEAKKANDNLRKAAIYSFFYGFDGGPKSRQILNFVLAKRFSIGSTKNQITSSRQLDSYFFKRKKDDQSSHFVRKIEKKGESYFTQIHYQVIGPKVKKSMLMDYTFYFRGDKISKVYYEFAGSFPLEN